MGSIPSPATRRSDASSAAGSESKKHAGEAASPGGSADILRVNDETVRAEDLWRGHRPELTGKTETLSRAEFELFVQQRAAQLITDKIAEMLLYQRSSERVTDEMHDRIDKFADNEIRKIVATQHDGIEQRYVRALESEGQTLDAIRARLRREIVIAGYLEQEVKPKVVEPTRAELVALYEEAAESLRRPERRRMSLIDVRILERLPEGVTEPTREQWQAARDQARSRVQTVVAELKSGSSFADLARRYSDGLHAADGGAWGWIRKGSVRERFIPAVLALYELGAGEVSEIIETEHGFFLVRCDELDAGFDPTFEAVQPELKERFARTAYNRLVAELVSEMRRQARIEPEDLNLFHAAVVGAGMKISQESAPSAGGPGG
jgi:parvulin-like peptidyl-prolyl isomerase